MSLLPPKAVLAIAAVTDIALNTRRALIRRPMRGKTLARRLGLPERHLEPVLQALTRHGILKGMRGSRGGYDLAREESRITAAEILRAAGTADEMDSPPIPDSGLLNSVVMPAVQEAERTFSAALARINIEDLAQQEHAASGPRREPQDGPVEQAGRAGRWGTQTSDEEQF